MSPASVLIVGASRGLGRALAEHYVSLQSRVFATVRSPLKPDQQFKGRIQVIEGIDCSQSDVGKRIVDGLKGETVEIVVIVAGLLKPEEFGKSSFEDEVSMYKICAIAPVLIVEDLATSSSLSPNAKILLLTSEAGSVTLRTQGEGGGMYGHHGSKAAGNMVGKLLSLDLKDRGVPVAMIHVRLLRLFVYRTRRESLSLVTLTEEFM
ncbi:cytoplasmic protein [Tremella mesenterica]|uniref:Cytoplasmic protein n=1 Tax=Tremella mesenterica TaxID=5217 RepID=A0A4Q1BBT0_TREME|nr:cytoplasmic protein [Tremella mesenterica]